MEHLSLQWRGLQRAQGQDSIYHPLPLRAECVHRCRSTSVDTWNMKIFASYARWKQDRNCFISRSIMRDQYVLWYLLIHFELKSCQCCPQLKLKRCLSFRPLGGVTFSSGSLTIGCCWISMDGYRQENFIILSPDWRHLFLHGGCCELSVQFILHHVSVRKDSIVLNRQTLFLCVCKQEEKWESLVTGHHCDIIICEKGDEKLDTGRGRKTGRGLCWWAVPEWICTVDWRWWRSRGVPALIGCFRSWWDLSGQDERSCCLSDWISAKLHHIQTAG